VVFATAGLTHKQKVTGINEVFQFHSLRGGIIPNDKMDSVPQ